MKKIKFAVQIGNSVTSIYKAGVGVVLTERSVVVTGIKSKREVAIAVGDDAIASGIEYRRVIENSKIDFSLAKLMLEHFFKKTGISHRDGIVILVSFDDMKRANEYKKLAYSLGINSVAVIPSMIATAYGFEIDGYAKNYLLVDIGINTEIAIVNNGRIVSGATVYNGGYNIDKKIIEYFYKEKGLDISKDVSERVKKELATLIPDDIRSITINGFIKDTTEYTSVSVTSKDIFNIFVDEYSTIARSILQLISTCDIDINNDIKRHGIYLCGASSRVTGIEKFFKAKLNLDAFRYKEFSVTMIGAGQILDSPETLRNVILENS